MTSASRPATTGILVTAGLAVAGALALRYLYLDNDAFRAVCDSAPERWSCTTRASLAFGLRHLAVGWGVLAFALVALIWPSAWRISIAVGAAACGLVLYQADLASGAGALLLLHLAVWPAYNQQQGHTP